MIFEKGWLLHKMNKYAPRGYKFVAVGPDGRIAMYAPYFMGKKSPSGPFVSCFSFDLLDSVYGGLLTRRSARLSQGVPLIEYIYSYDLGRPQNIPADEKYEIYRSVVAQHIHTYCRPQSVLIRKNAILIHGLQAKNAYLPEYLNTRLNTYVNKSTWYAIERVFASMPICDVKFYQEQYRAKMSELGIVHGEHFGGLDVEKISNEKRYADLIEQIENLRFGTLPRQEKSLARAIAKQKPAEQQQLLQNKIDKTKSTLAELIQQQNAMCSETPDCPAHRILPDVFWGGTSTVIPKISRNKYLQMLQLLFMRTAKIKNK